MPRNSIIRKRGSKVPSSSFYFVLAIFCYVCGLPLIVVYFSSDTPLKKTKSALVNSYHLELASSLEVGVCPLLLAVRTDQVQTHGGHSHATAVSVCMYLSHVLESLILLVFFTPSASYIRFLNFYVSFTSHILITFVSQAFHICHLTLHAPPTPSK